MSPTDFRKIHDEFRPRITSYLGGMVGKENAEDLAQVVFEKVNRGMDSFRGESSLATWIYRIATNVALNYLNSPAARRTAIPLETIATIDPHCDCVILRGEKPLDADHGLIRRDMNACIHRILKQMPESERAVLLLSEFEGMKNSEIADILNLSLATVKIRLHRARKRLKKDIEAECTLFRDERNELLCNPKQRNEL
jgi:RNA polymerase sigma-70 factor (ECF subfamily)